jgi:hypothetical protein
VAGLLNKSSYLAAALHVTNLQMSEIRFMSLLLYLSLTLTNPKGLRESRGAHHTVLGQFVERKFLLSSSLRYDQIYKCQIYDLFHSLLCYLSLTLTNPPQRSWRELRGSSYCLRLVSYIKALAKLQL